MELNREFFTRPLKRKVSKVKLTDGKVAYLRELSAFEYAEVEVEALVMKDDKPLHMDMRKYKNGIVAKSLCDKDGNDLLSEDDYDLVSKTLGEADLVLLMLEARKINRLDDDIEDLAGK